MAELPPDDGFLTKRLKRAEDGKPNSTGAPHLHNFLFVVVFIEDTWHFQANRLPIDVSFPNIL
jgi:hypothetical protein